MFIGPKAWHILHINDSPICWQKHVTSKTTEKTVWHTEATQKVFNKQRALVPGGQLRGIHPFPSASLLLPIPFWPPVSIAAMKTDPSLPGRHPSLLHSISHIAISNTYLISPFLYLESLRWLPTFSSKCSQSIGYSIPSQNRVLYDGNKKHPSQEDVHLQVIGSKCNLLLYLRVGVSCRIFKLQ